MRVDQVTPHLAQRDAVGVHTINVRDALRAAGIDSDIYYGTASNPTRLDSADPVTALGRHDAKIVGSLYQSSVGSPIFDLFAARDEPKLVNYHNITPSSLLIDWEPEIAFEVALGRAQLARLARRIRLALADSSLQRARTDRPRLRAQRRWRPPASTWRPGASKPDSTLLEDIPTATRQPRAARTCLFVGKVSPHKAPHDLVKMLSVLRDLYDPEARLHLVGSPLGDTYEPALRTFIHELGLDGAVFLPGPVSGPELEAYYRVGRRLRLRFRT